MITLAQDPNQRYSLLTMQLLKSSA